MEERSLQEKERIRQADASEASIRKHSPAKPTAHSMEELKEMASPKESLATAMTPKSDNLNFGLALYYLKQGMRVARKGWNGKSMFLYLVKGSTFAASDARAECMKTLTQEEREYGQVEYCPHIDMKTADNKRVPWLASQTDILAEDWVLLP